MVALPAVADQAELVARAAAVMAEIQMVQIPQAQLIQVAVVAAVAVVPENLVARRAVLASLLSVTLGRKFIPAAL